MKKKRCRGVIYYACVIELKDVSRETSVYIINNVGMILVIALFHVWINIEKNKNICTHCRDARSCVSTG